MCVCAASCKNHQIFKMKVQGMSCKKIAFITGIAGQDGAYLAEFLLGKGYDVHGLLRWDSYPETNEGMSRLQALNIHSRVRIHVGDITDAMCVARIIQEIRPSEIYNLAALSQVGVSFLTPASVIDINQKGTLAILEAVRVLGMESDVRIYQASSSEMFGSAKPPQNEMTAFEPCSPYGVSKLASYWLARTYRDSYGMFVSNGILFNHESPQRGEDFVTRKITSAAARIEAGEPIVLTLGNIDSIRDWGHARDYVRGMWQILNHTKPDDFVLATGRAHTVRECVDIAYAHVGIRLRWQGDGVEEVGKHARNGKILVRIDPSLFRPKDVNYLLGDPKKAMNVLGWKPEYDFKALIADMVNADRAALRVHSEPMQWQKIG